MNWEAVGATGEIIGAVDLPIAFEPALDYPVLSSGRYQVEKTL